MKLLHQTFHRYRRSLAQVKLVLLLFVISTAVLLSFTLSTSRAISQLNQEWQTYGQQSQSKYELINHLRASIGYMGFIHYFKNYVIRRDAEYLRAAHESMVTSQELLHQYQQQTLNPQEQAALNDLKMVISDYQQKLASIEHTKVADMPIRALDQRVKVDDTAAANALVILNTLLEDDYHYVNQQTTDLLNIAKQRLQLLSGIGIPLLIIFCLYASALVIRATRSKSHLETLFSMIPEGILVADRSGRVVRTNPHASDIFGYPAATLLGKQLDELICPDAVQQNIRSAFQQGRGDDTKPVFYGIHQNGESLPLDIELATLNGHRSIHRIAMIRCRKEELKLKQLSESDHLTGVRNRLGIDRILYQEIERCQRYEHPLAFLLIDIDHFKAINDQLGHQAGDHIIITVADVLKEESRPSDSIGRWGGDEFCVICPEVCAEGAAELASRLQKRLSQSNLIHPRTQQAPTLSIGIAELIKGDDPSALFARADQSLYRSKAQGRNCICIDGSEKPSFLC
ncbi:diguanylate cyclase [Bacterioplanoides sp.]|uniref:GGDEF domain-containing protein n=1 Tax=Bacterioplanoides sp. TaxID=2066072 RepID=UPI003B00ADB0